MSNLTNSDLFVVQRPSGDTAGTYSINWQTILQNIAATPTVLFRGARDFTDANDDPSPNYNGDMYVSNTSGVFAWANSESGTDPKNVLEGDYVIWDNPNSVWRFIGNIHDGNVDSVSGQLPLSPTNDDTTGNVTVESRQATDLLSGHVARLATANDVAFDNNSPSSIAVVTADLLQATNAALDVGNINGLTDISAVQDPNPPSNWTITTYNGTNYTGNVSTLNVSMLSPDNTGPTRSIAVSLASQSTPGVFLAPTTSDIDPTNGDINSPDGGLSRVHAVTPNLLYQYYTPRNFDDLNELP